MLASSSRGIALKSIHWCLPLTSTTARTAFRVTVPGRDLTCTTRRTAYVDPRILPSFRISRRLSEHSQGTPTSLLVSVSGVAGWPVTTLFFLFWVQVHCSPTKRRSVEIAGTWLASYGRLVDDEMIPINSLTKRFHFIARRLDR